MSPAVQAVVITSALARALLRARARATALRKAARRPSSAANATAAAAAAAPAICSLPLTRCGAGGAMDCGHCQGLPASSPAARLLGAGFAHPRCFCMLGSPSCSCPGLGCQILTALRSVAACRAIVWRAPTAPTCQWLARRLVAATAAGSSSRRWDGLCWGYAWCCDPGCLVALKARAKFYIA